MYLGVFCALFIFNSIVLLILIILF